MEASLQHPPMILVKEDSELADALVLEFTEHVSFRKNEVFHHTYCVALVLHEEPIQCFLDLTREYDLSHMVIMPGCEEGVEVAIAHEIQ